MMDAAVEFEALARAVEEAHELGRITNRLRFGELLQTTYD